jgi:hypothetical protein
MPISKEIEDRQLLGLLALACGALGAVLGAFYVMWHAIY